MKAKELVMGCLVILLAGCVPIVSLHPLFTKEDVVFDEKLLGTWVNDANDPEITWEFARLEEDDTDTLPEVLQDQIQRVYHLSLTDDEGRKGSFVASLVKLKGRLFLDIFPDKLPSNEQDFEKMKLPYNAFFFLPVHTFLRVDAIGERLQMCLTDDEQFAELLKAKPDAIRHEMIDDRPVLTAGTQELQAFVLKHADGEQFFANDVTLIRKSQ